MTGNVDYHLDPGAATVYATTAICQCPKRPRPLRYRRQTANFSDRHRR